MSYSLLIVALLLAGGAATVHVARGMRLRRVALRRAGLQAEEPESVFAPVMERREMPTFPRRFPFAGLWRARSQPV